MDTHASVDDRRSHRDPPLLVAPFGDCRPAPAVWDELTVWERPVHTETAELWRSSKAYWWAVGLVMMLVSFFFARIIAPLLSIMLQTFNSVDHEEMFVADHIETAIYVVLAASSLCAICWMAWRVVTWHPESWLRRYTAKSGRERALCKANIWRLLSLNLTSGVPTKTSIEQLARLHQDARIRRQLSIASESIANGTNAWQSLVNAKLLHTIERDAITATDDPAVQAWTLRHLALRNRESLHFEAMRRNMWIQPIVTLLFGAFVLAIAYAVFSTLAQLVSVLAERHG